MRNEELHISECLESLSRQTYPKDRFEVLVIDGLSEDKTLEIVGRFEGRLNLRVLQNPKVKHVYAFNQGIREARGDYFVLVSGHSFVEKDFIEKSVESFFLVRQKEPRVAAVGGRIEKVYENSLAKLVSLIYSSPFSGGSSFWYSREPHFAETVASGFYDKEIVERVGGFDEDMITGNDFEFNLRLVRSGYKLYYDPSIRVYYYVRSSFSRFLGQSFNYGAVKGVCTRKGFFKFPWVVPTLFVLYQLLMLFLVVSGVSLSFVLLVPFIFYWVSSFLASVLLVRGDVFGLFLPGMYWLFHNVIGLGFLKGILLGKNTFKQNVKSIV